MAALRKRTLISRLSEKERRRELREKRRRWRKQVTCRCPGWWFPHRYGCKWCEGYRGEYTDEDYEERYYKQRVVV